MPPTYTYDAGALIAADRRDERILALHRRAMTDGLFPTVPAGVLAQAWRGGPQAALSLLLKGCRVESLGQARARSAGAACARAGTSDVVDASVVVGAAIRGDIIVTSDRADIEALGQALGLPVKIIDI